MRTHKMFHFKNKRVKYITPYAVIKEGVTEKEGYGGVNYLIYADYGEDEFKIRINTCFKMNGDKTELLNSYDCGLCRNIAEFEKLSSDEIERMAYNCYMTGAR